jgi:hypothetical protein
MKNIYKLLILLVISLIFLPSVCTADSQSSYADKYVFAKEGNVPGGNYNNVVIVMGKSEINSDINGSVINFMGDVKINGTVNGDVVSLLGNLNLNDKSFIEGNLVSFGTINKPDNIAIKGKKMVVNMDVISAFKSNGILISLLIILSLLTLVVGLVLITIFPVNYRVMSHSIHKKLGKKISLGILLILALTIIVAFLFFLIVIPIVYILAFVFADVIGSIFIGRLVFKQNDQRSSIYLEFFIGVVLVSIVKIIPLIIIPQYSYIAILVYGILYAVVELAIASVGLGTVVVTSFGRNNQAIKKT